MFFVFASKITVLGVTEWYKPILLTLPPNLNFQNSKGKQEDLSSLVQIGSIRRFNRLCDEFPMQARIFHETMDKSLKDIEIPQYTSEEEQAQWEQLKTRIRERYGENAI